MKKSRKLWVSAVVVAAGKGTRMNMDINKQYIKVCGIPLLARTLKVFEDCSLIDEVVLVVSNSDMFYCKQNVVEAYELKKVKMLVAGGEQRQDSVYNGLIQVNNESDIIIIHDGARPFINDEIIENCIEAAQEYGASTVAVPVKDTIKSADSGGFVKETLERSTLWAIQTPQAFLKDVIIKAHEKAADDGFYGTDDTVLAERMGIRTKLVMGSYNNIKITTREDLTFAEAVIGNAEVY
ncbi:2-C-methyl-D-erythritol 4-phosphate cytidylyltransferase [Acetivibrio mesophilus]|uniref:2-C-methyl-D-erythritol 4-phosphate cytidylyltransferase n=1 Tax=Acetivibrio mesophilus TaxID=2487273 RepID=A0A4Q0I2B2_9FIRM|nr:2-C-methyl-D-erythritol 4-phosphate cytidylyltransferase [Acetivibrio mesophilus]ODM26695.1 2-C-methyl-D-erythritol 4-phosphate cytidylyltransferase [Clostridium sp. Bc-iso-3]RXE58281.1 2-C-methyl-D-erythritol 4-phosphate cytidylyltransferase [Acetivibrio mesophilus]HHV30594.1 2-C-methyl-D-erythritol 4-phosphate cytidylyltransferase [Clostridium sp.]